MDALKYVGRAFWLALACFAAMALLPAASFASSMRYTVTDLGLSTGNGLENDGRVVESHVRRSDLGQIPQSDMRKLPYQLRQIINIVDGADDGRLLFSVYGTGSYTKYFIYDPTYNNDGAGFIEFGAGDSLRSVGAYDMNARGDVVGQALSGTPDWFPFLYDGVTGELLNLRDLVSFDSGLEDFGAYAINDSGQILTSAFVESENTYHDFLLTPQAVPEPTTLALAVVVGAAVGIRRLRQPRKR